MNPWSGTLYKSANFGIADVYLQNLIWKNNNGKLEKYSKENKLTISQVPSYMKAYSVNNKFKFIGIRGNSDGTLTVTEIKPVF